jgi:hypothetical protein
MAARDRFELTLRCPKCGATGEAKVSEDDYPFMRSPHFRVDEAPEGFDIVKTANVRAQTEAIHIGCGVRFHL